MRRLRFALGACAAAAVLLTSGCAADSNTSALEDSLASTPGVNSALSWVTHPGAPWNTEVQVILFLDAGTDDAVVAATEGASRILAADDVSRGHTVQMSYVEGRREDYPTRDDALSDKLPFGGGVFERLGLPESSTNALRLSPGDVQRLASGG